MQVDALQTQSSKFELEMGLLIYDIRLNLCLKILVLLLYICPLQLGMTGVNKHISC